MRDYQSFLESKRIRATPVGFEPDHLLHRVLKDFQAYAVRWMIRRGRGAVFGDCGTGKTLMQLEWNRHVQLHTQMPTLILAPIDVCEQTREEAFSKMGLEVTVCASQADVKPGINITNYEKLHKFEREAFGALTLDESSILKSFDGDTRKAVTEFAQAILYRSAWTATPAPNDLIELTNHAEFLDIMGGKEIIALFFTQDGNTTHEWRLKGHAREDFWKWMASWCLAFRKPSDLGNYSDEGFNLPPLRKHYIEVPSDPQEQAQPTLFPMEAQTLTERRQARKESLSRRVEKAKEVVGDSAEKWVLWCDRNDEQAALEKAFGGTQVSIHGKTNPEDRLSLETSWRLGAPRDLITKPALFAWGMNWQHANKMVFVGVSDSFEQQYQAIRREWRFGQKNPVDVYFIYSEAERAVIRNIQRKEKQAMEMFEEIVRHTKGHHIEKAQRNEMVYREDVAEGKGWRVMLGDSVKRIQEVESDSVGLSVFSPPFPGMYAYTNSPHDMGNAKTFEELIEHFRFLMQDLLRITMPGRSCVMHITQGVAFKGQDGYAGLKDFRGKIIEAMTAAGWIHYGEVTIDKNPQVKAIRTRDAGLQFKSLATDAARMHVAMADYLLQFRKPGENPNPIKAGISEKYKNQEGWISADEWILWARPVWYGDDLMPGLGIRETDVLNVSMARDQEDEKHLCPLQLGVIERCIKLWTNPGEVVFSPFTGVGSEGYQAVRFGRKFIGCELKESYWRHAVKHLRQAEESKQSDIFAPPSSRRRREVAA
jgi:hypothetical protein